MNAINLHLAAQAAIDHPGALQVAGIFLLVIVGIVLAGSWFRFR